MNMRRLIPMRKALLVTFTVALCFSNGAEAEKKETKPANNGQPTLVIYSSPGCPPCNRIHEEMQHVIDIGWCRLTMETVMVPVDCARDKSRVAPRICSGADVGHVPYIALRYANGRWKDDFQQYPSGKFTTITEYVNYLYLTIHAAVPAACSEPGTYPLQLKERKAPP